MKKKKCSKHFLNGTIRNLEVAHHHSIWDKWKERDSRGSIVIACLVVRKGCSEEELTKVSWKEHHIPLV